ncbi:MAG: 50S ribosomal protein L4 [Clostridia bacterium]|nr:50S ribosomal protein L4 [Clostridia bacterium]
MAKIDIFDMTGKVVGETELNDAIFGIEPNMSAVHTVVVNYLANQRQGTQSALTRAEVSGGGRKPWRQKGTGRARQGSIRAPQWHHGGVAFAPKPREYRYSINKKIRRLALKSVLSDKAAEGKIILVDSIQAEEYKTSVIAKFLKAIKAEGKIMLAYAGENDKLYRSARNIEKVNPTDVTLINTYKVLGSDYLVLDQAALAKLEEVFA